MSTWSEVQSFVRARYLLQEDAAAHFVMSFELPAATAGSDSPDGEPAHAASRRGQPGGGGSDPVWPAPGRWRGQAKLALCGPRSAASAR